MTTLQEQSDAWLIIKEAWLRWQQRTPRFFRVLKVFNAVLVLVGGIPQALIQTGIILPPVWASRLSLVVTAIGAWGWLMSKLPVSQPNPETMPFTRKKEIEQIVENAKKPDIP